MNRLHDDDAAKRIQETQQQAPNDYWMNLNAWMRGTHCYPGAAGNVCSTYGPLDNTTNGPMLARDSFLGGRGQALSNCAECEVRWLPSDLFSSAWATTGDSDMLKHELTHAPKSCDSLADVDMSAYVMFPRCEQERFSAVNVQTFGESSKLVGRLADLPSGTADRDAQAGITSYGFYPRLR